MRHLYTAEPKDEVVIDHAKGFERRRCGHHTLDEPLSTMECFASVIDPKGSRTNKNRYVVATQDPRIRAYLRTIPGVPVIYIKRSVMIMEPMGGATEKVKEREEKAKFKAGIIGSRVAGTDRKRKRNEDESSEESEDDDVAENPTKTTGSATKVKKNKGVKGPNPLSVRKAKKPAISHDGADTTASGPSTKRRRVRKHKSTKETGANQATATAAASNDTT